ncbi:tripeptidyl-peptidase [Podospora aff. communis PSN243]|uniref:tripeptidyl-peptidase II n=1 Tax=Podospora aff. communis PSN243 TaxID=3040156 RepID=A0AAV9GC36_9PEZI|nr:tripeptidyl-peptidase [Podospora aff. communis PSN243]
MWCWLPLALLGLPIASVYAASAVLLEKTEGLPPGWVLESAAKGSEKISVSVVLKEPGIEALKHKVLQRSESGGGHMSREEIQQYRKTDKKAVNSVTSWLKSNGVGDLKVEGSFINFVATVNLLDLLFQAHMAHYSFGDDTTSFLRTLNYTVPAALRDSIDFVHPITNFIAPRGGRGKGRHGKHGRKVAKGKTVKGKGTDGKGKKGKTAKTTSKASCAKPISASSSAAFSTTTTPSLTLAPTTSKTPTYDVPIVWPTLTLNPDDPYWGGDHTWEDQEPDYPCITGSYPECIRELYNITYNATGPSPSRFGVAGFLEQWIHHKDVELFVDNLAPELKNVTPAYNYTVELFRGAVNPQPEYVSSGIEAALDIQYALAIGYPTEVVYYITAGRGTKLDRNGEPLPEIESDNEPYLEFLEDLLAKPDSEIPHVLSISYADDELGIPRPYALKVCDLFAALSARGVSVFVATGDGGAAGTGQTRCVSNDGQNRRMYVPTFPASCPYVTAVGATSNIAPPLAGADYSSGGFSNYFSRPVWQQAAVQPYVDYMVRTNDTERLPLFNRTGRAMPDISAVGSAFQIYQNGNLQQVLGTSASTPVVAAMVALVNDARMRKGKPSLGWLNPVLYSERVKKVLRDVTWGRSYGCYFPDGTSSLGWRAGRGYDAVTGLGTVDDFNDFLRVLMDV